MHTQENTSRSFSVRSKVWIEDANGQVVFGSGRYRILDAVQRLGSLMAAARELNMSYKALWARITATERRLGIPLLIKESTGSRLTPEAEDLMKRFRRVNTLVISECDEVFATVIKDALEGDTQNDAE